jgi:TRAP transporter 4TM/12TM fusion protein
MEQDRALGKWRELIVGTNEGLGARCYEATISLIAVTFSLFQMYSAFLGSFTDAVQRSIHLGFALSLTFLIFNVRGAKTRRFSFVNAIFAMICVFCAFYRSYYCNDLVFSQGRIDNLDFAVGALIILTVIEVSRRIIGLPLVIAAVLSIIYLYFGNLFPGIIRHAGYSIKGITDLLAVDVVSQNGIFGIPLGVSTRYVFIFILFGSFYDGAGGTTFIMNLSKVFIGRLQGGAAKLAVVSSGLFGMISGSASANVTVTGSITIPLMKRSGFPGHFAAAAEATSSTGGLIMPPVMGAVGFIIAEVLGISYLEVAKAAFLPAVLYYTSLYFGVHLFSKNANLSKIPREEIPKLRDVLREGWLLIIPVFVLVFLLAFIQLSPTLSAFWSIIAIIGMNMLSRQRLGIVGIVRCLKKGAEQSLIVVSTLAIVGIPMGAILGTGIGLKFGDLLIQAAGGNMLLILGMAMIASLILGTGMESTSAYIMVSIILIPALVKFGIPPISSHMFAFYFGLLSNVTPPVAITSYVAAGLANSNAFKTAITGFRLSIAGFIIPYMLIYRPALMLQGSALETVYAFIVFLVACFALQAGVWGYWFRRMNVYLRLVSFVCAVLLIFPGVATDILGFALIGIVTFIQRKGVVVPSVKSVEVSPRQEE